MVNFGGHEQMEAASGHLVEQVPVDLEFGDNRFDRYHRDECSCYHHYYHSLLVTYCLFVVVDDSIDLYCYNTVVAAVVVDCNQNHSFQTLFQGMNK